MATFNTISVQDDDKAVVVTTPDTIGFAGDIFASPVVAKPVSIRDLKVGDASVDLLLTRHDEGDVGVNVLRRNGTLDVVVLK